MSELISENYYDNEKDKFFDEMKLFFDKSVHVWQSYIPYNFIKDINLSLTQKKIINLQYPQIIINGSAGSGKSIVLLYKLIKIMLEEKEPKKFLYLSYNQTLIDDTLKRAYQYSDFEDLKHRHEVVDICTFHNFATKILKILGFKELKKIKIDYSTIEKFKENSIRRVASFKFKYDFNGVYYNDLKEDERLFKTHSLEFIRDEILWMKANGYINIEEYLECERAGRGNTPRLLKNQRKTIFKIYKEYEELKRDGKWVKTISDLEDYAIELLKRVNEIPETNRYDYIYVDEVQDFDFMQLKVLTSLFPNSLIIAGDPKQRIYRRTPHNYNEIGIDIKASNKTLYENYRSTEEIMNLANSLNFTDIVKDNSKIKYINKGNKPRISLFNNWMKAIETLGNTILDIHSKDPNSTIAIITREEGVKALGNASTLRTLLAKYCSLIDIEKYASNFKYSNQKQVIYTDLFNVKGLEFDYVFILQFDNRHYPNYKEIEKFEKLGGSKGSSKENNDSYKDYDDLVNTEKKRLYVAMTRAKKKLELYCVTRTKAGISNFFYDFNDIDYEFKEYKTRERR